MIAPFGEYATPKRNGGFAAASAAGAKAGIIESRKGSPTAAPMPFSKVRRERDFFAMNIQPPRYLAERPRQPHEPSFRLRRHSHLERHTLDNSHDYCREF